MKIDNVIGSTRTSRGYNLVEVLVAIGILASVLLGIVTLFVMGRANVYSGKQMSEAVSIGNRVLEDLASMTATDVISNFGLTDTVGTNTFNGNSYANSILLTVNETGTYTGYRNSWQQLFNEQGHIRFTTASINLLFLPSNWTDPNKKMTTAQFLRILGSVEWNEARRHRAMTFETSKVNRQ